MFITDDPLADFDRWDAEQQRKIDLLPVCDYCDETIIGDYYFEINGEVICEDCLDRYFRKEVEE